MKVLFIQPPTNPHVWGGDAIFVLEPLWAEYLGAGLRPDTTPGFSTCGSSRCPWKPLSRTSGLTWWR